MMSCYRLRKTTRSFCFRLYISTTKQRGRVRSNVSTVITTTSQRRFTVAGLRAVRVRAVATA